MMDNTKQIVKSLHLALKTGYVTMPNGRITAETISAAHREMFPEAYLPFNVEDRVLVKKDPTRRVFVVKAIHLSGLTIDGVSQAKYCLVPETLADPLRPMFRMEDTGDIMNVPPAY